MGATQYVVSEEAYLTVLLHSVKYPSCTVCGVLLGQAGSGVIEVTGAVPLFHLSMLMAPCVETALSLVEAYAHGMKQQIMGYYHAEARMNAQDIHPVGKRIADRLAERQQDGFILMLSNPKLEAFNRQGSCEPPFELLLRDSSAAKANWKKVPAGSSAGALSLKAGSTWEQLRARFLNMHAKGQHALLADFDEHLDDVSKDFTNPQLFTSDSAVLRR